MSSPGTVTALEEQLKEAGDKLLQPPSSLDELLPLLDEVGSSLSKVEQSPAKSTHSALSSSMKALVANELLRHPDTDAKVAVASCISEITRITAPDAPYDDDKMKDIFQLFVSAFENLSDKSSRSYNKRALILEIVAKVRSCVIMLDLECDELITEMFQIFLRNIRDYHPDGIFSSMETIMSLVVDESEDISADLLTILLSSVKKDNQEVSPTARRLGERVFANCAVKLKPYLILAKKALGISLDDYGKIVTSVCEGTVGHNNDIASREQLADGSNPARTSSIESAQETKDVPEACQEDLDPAANLSPKSTVHVGISETKQEETSVKVESPEKGKHLVPDKITINEGAPNAGSDDSETEKSKSESEPEQSSEEKGGELKSLMKLTESSDPSSIDGEKEAEKLPDNRESDAGKDSDSSAIDDMCPEEANNLEIENDICESEAHEGENVASLSSSEGFANATPPREAEGPKKKGSLIEEEIPPSEVVTEKASERTSDSEAKPQRQTVTKAPSKTTNKDNTSSKVGTSKTEDGTSDSEAKPRKQPGTEMDASVNDEDDSSMKEKEDMKKRGRGKASIEKEAIESSTKDDMKSAVSSPKSPAKSVKEEDHEDEIRTKRKPTSIKEKSAVSSPKSPAKSVMEEDHEDEIRTKRKRTPIKEKSAVSSPKSPAKSVKEEDHKDEIRTKRKRTPIKEKSAVSSPKSPAKYVEEDHEDEIRTKRKRTPIKEKSAVSSPKSPAKSVEEEDHEEEIRTKRKRTPIKEKASKTMKYGENFVGLAVKVWWPKDRMFYEGVIDSFDSVKKKHKVLYNDGDEEILNLRKERWEIIEDDSLPDVEAEAGPASTDASSKMQQKKNAKRSADSSAKHEPMEVLPKRGLSASSSKLKGTSSKPGKKSKDAGKVDPKFRDGTSKSEDETSNKSKARSEKIVSKSVNDSSKSSGKSKNLDGNTPKSKSKQDAAKTASKSKEDTLKTAAKSKGKSNADDFGKVKSSSSKGKEGGEVKKNPNDLTKTPQGTKRKLSNLPKERKSETKGGKKRQRNVKG